MLIGVALLITLLTGMTKKIANIIQAGLNLEVNKVCGPRVGLAAERNGMSLAVLLGCTEAIQKQLR